MKPSISIDLPGWCTLQRCDSDDDERPQRDGGNPSTLDLDELGDMNRRRIDNSSSSRSAAVLDDMDSDDEGDGDGAIARLFSIGGLKRRRSDSESRSRPQSLSQLETAKIDQAQSARMQRQRQSRQGANASPVFDLQAEAYVDWPCVRCTFINTYDQEVCGGCGGGNVKRERRLRARRKEVERLGRLQSARESRDKSLKAEALKDVLEDSDSEGNGSIAHTSETQGNPGTVNPITISMPVDESKTTLTSPLAEMAPAVWTTCSDKGSQNSSSGYCFVNIFPPDLLLQCAEFLGDVTTLCRVREVSMAWLFTLDGRESGWRLWRPVFYRLRANGSIHAATDNKGQQRRQLKVYDLGTPTSASSTGRCPASVGSGAGVHMVTPSPVTRGSSLSPGRGLKDRTSRELRSPPGSEAGTVGGSPGPRRSSACLVCGLIQRAGFTGKDCEMCASSLMVLPGAPATPRVAYTRVNLSESAGENVVLTSSSMVVGSASKVSARCTSAAGSAAHLPVAGVSAGPGGCGNGGDGDGENMGKDGDVDNVDWHFLVKRLAEEKRIASGWGPLRHGWVWLQNALQAMLRRRRGDGTSSTSRSNEEHVRLNYTKPGSSCGGGSSDGKERVSAPPSPGRGGDVGLGDLDPTISRLVRKLTSKKWVLLYDSLKTTFTLQAQCIARETAFAVQPVAANEAAMNASGTGNGLRRANCDDAELEGLRGCIAAWEAYKEWCEEVDMYCELLNEQISAERYRNAGSGCGRGDSTPYVRDTALLSFRHSFVLNVHICSILRAAIARGVSSVHLDSAVAFEDLRRQVTRSESRSAPTPDFNQVLLEARGATGVTIGAADEIFTDQELIEDSRTIDFSIGKSFSGARAGAAGCLGKRCGGMEKPGYSLGGVFDDTSTGAGLRYDRPVTLAPKRRGNYYDWFLSKLEGKEAGIIRGYVDLRGKSLVRPDGSVRKAGSVGIEAGAQEDGERLAKAGVKELLDLAGDMIEELDVPDDHLSKDRHTQGAMRRLLLLPFKRWQVIASEVSEEEPHKLLMAGLSPAPGKEGFHRLRSGAAGRRKKTPPFSTLGKDAGESWEKFSSFFG